MWGSLRLILITITQLKVVVSATTLVMMLPCKGERKEITMYGEEKRTLGTNSRSEEQ